MNCPRCKTALSESTLKDSKASIKVNKCDSCQGAWFEKGALQAVENLVEPIFWEKRDLPSDYDQLTALFCPNCIENPLMNKAEHPRDKNVIFDYCENCNGIWLDKGELEAIQKENWLITLGRFFG